MFPAPEAMDWVCLMPGVALRCTPARPQWRGYKDSAPTELLSFWVMTSNPGLWRAQIPIRIGAWADANLSAAGGSGPAFGPVR
ncbi:hypothetical protein GCM10027454_09370 [Algoriphagus aestuariicola]